MQSGCKMLLFQLHLCKAINDYTQCKAVKSQAQNSEATVTTHHHNKGSVDYVLFKVSGGISQMSTELTINQNETD